MADPDVTPWPDAPPPAGPSDLWRTIAGVLLFHPELTGLSGRALRAVVQSLHDVLAARYGPTNIYRHPFTDTHAGGVRTDGLCNLCAQPREHPAHRPTL